MVVPPTVLDLGAVVAAVACLWVGASWFVDGASTTARRLGIPGLIVGLTVVAMGTSAPEFAVTIDAALAGKADISVGNVVGSNVLNLGFVLGGAALVRALPTSRPLLRRDGPVLVGATALVLVLLRDLRVSRLDGAALAALLVVYLLVLARSGRREAGSNGPSPREDRETPAPVDGPLGSDADPVPGVDPSGAGATPDAPGGIAEQRDGSREGSSGTGGDPDGSRKDPDGTGGERDGSTSGGVGDDERAAIRPVDVARLVVGLALVVGGAHLLVLGASNLARDAGVSEWVIGATVVAAGTSTPEFVTSVVAARQGRPGISGGNVVGSCIFNLFGVLGVAALIRPLAVAPVAIDGLWWLAGTTLVAAVLLGTRRVLSRVEGGLLVAINAVNWVVDFLL